MSILRTLCSLGACRVETSNTHDTSLGDFSPNAECFLPFPLNEMKELAPAYIAQAARNTTAVRLALSKPSKKDSRSMLRMRPLHTAALFNSTSHVSQNGIATGCLFGTAQREVGGPLNSHSITCSLRNEGWAEGGGSNQLLNKNTAINEGTAPYESHNAPATSTCTLSPEVCTTINQLKAAVQALHALLPNKNSNGHTMSTIIVTNTIHDFLYATTIIINSTTQLILLISIDYTTWAIACVLNATTHTLATAISNLTYHASYLTACTASLCPTSSTISTMMQNASQIAGITSSTTYTSLCVYAALKPTASHGTAKIKNKANTTGAKNKTKISKQLSRDRTNSKLTAASTLSTAGHHAVAQAPLIHALKMSR